MPSSLNGGRVGAADRVQHVGSPARSCTRRGSCSAVDGTVGHQDLSGAQTREVWRGPRNVSFTGAQVSRGRTRRVVHVHIAATQGRIERPSISIPSVSASSIARSLPCRWARSGLRVVGRADHATSYRRHSVHALDECAVGHRLGSRARHALADVAGLLSTLGPHRARRPSGFHNLIRPPFPSGRSEEP